MIVVIDTNVWISALQFGRGQSTPMCAIETALTNDQLAVCPGIYAEITRILIERFNWIEAEANRIVAAYFKNALVVPVFGTVRICRDPNDDMVLECAYRSAADLIVSGDKDLLALESYEGIRIVTAAEFLALHA